MFKIKNINLLSFFIYYSIFGFFINIISKGKFFEFLYENGFEYVLKYIFAGNTTWIGNHVRKADENFFYIYFSFFIFIIGIYFLNNLKKIIFSNNFVIKTEKKNFLNINKKEIFFNIVLAAGLSLFLELSIIRIHSSYLHFFSFLKNVSLISCFLGLGIGYSLVKHKIYSINWIYPLLTLQIIMLFFLNQTPISTILINPIAEQITMGQDTARGISHLIIIYIFIVFIFLFNAMAFVPIGHLISKLMSEIDSLHAYSLNLVGSFLGILLFVFLSFILTSPVVWILVSFVFFLLIVKKDFQKYFLSIICVFILTLILTLNLKGKKETIYSPYQNISVEHLNTPLNPVIIQSSHIFYQAILNLSEDLSWVYKNRAPGNIFGHNVDVKHEREFYNIPYLITKNKPEKVMIIGSGAGNDVAAANRFNIKEVDAVEIDPVIANLGIKYHPEFPYNPKGVNLVINDARSYIKNTKKKYDVIVYGLLDSQSNLSSKGGIRLDSYVYTVEAFSEAKDKLNNNGFICLSFFVQTPELGYKIFKMLEMSFGSKPLVLKSDVNDRYIFVATKNEENIVLDKIKYFKKIESYNQEKLYEIDLSTDNWPFIYMPSRTYPFTYLSIVILLIFSSVFFINRINKIKVKDFSFTCFFLGAGFMLIETKSITEMAKIFGSTWIVTSVVIGSILLMAFFANYLVIKKIKISSFQTYFLLFFSLFLGFYYSTYGFELIPKNIINFVLPLILALPILFSGLAFSKELFKLNSVSKALSSNILGAMFGGFLEYNSMYFGLSFLYFLAGFLYFLAFIFSSFNFKTFSN